MIPTTLRCGLLLAALLPFAAIAHDDATLDKMKTPNGGQLRMAGAYHFELVLDRSSKEPRDNAVLLYLTDHGDAKLPSAGTKATVTLLGSGTKATASLQPDGGNRLKGMARYAATADLKAVVSFTAADGKNEQARFTPFAAIPAAASPAPAAGGGGHRHH